MGVISVAGRKQDKHCRVKIRLSPPPPGGEARKAAAEITPNDALLRFVRALARAAAIADYEQEHPTRDLKSDDESSDLRQV